MLCSDKPPELEGAANSLLTTVEILTVDEVDTFNMEVGLTFRVGIRWTDPRLNYSNILARPYSSASLVRVLGTAVLQQWTVLWFRQQPGRGLAPHLRPLPRQRGAGHRGVSPVHWTVLYIVSGAGPCLLSGYPGPRPRTPGYHHRKRRGHHLLRPAERAPHHSGLTQTNWSGQT